MPYFRNPHPMSRHIKLTSAVTRLDLGTWPKAHRVSTGISEGFQAFSKIKCWKCLQNPHASNQCQIHQNMYISFKDKGRFIACYSIRKSVTRFPSMRRVRSASITPRNSEISMDKFSRKSKNLYSQTKQKKKKP